MIAEDMIRDVAIKAAEAVSGGMHCKDVYFEERPNALVCWLWEDEVLASAARASNKCAYGAIGVAALDLGLRRMESVRIAEELSRRITAACDQCGNKYYSHLDKHNDLHLSSDPFTAGAQLAREFRAAVGL